MPEAKIRRVWTQGSCVRTRLSAFIGDIFQNVLYPAVQNLAQGVQGRGGDGLAVLHAVEGVGGHALLEDQVVFCDIFSI